MLAIILKFIVDNPWRTGCIVLLLICAGLYATIRIQSLRIREANISLQEEKAKLAKVVTDGIVQERRIVIAVNELASLRKNQIADAKRIADLLKKWPKTCEEAATVAAGILRERKGQ